LSLSNVVASDEGSYTVVITNSGGAVTSAVAQVYVLSPWALTNQPGFHSISASCVDAQTVRVDFSGTNLVVGMPYTVQRSGDGVSWSTVPGVGLLKTNRSQVTPCRRSHRFTKPTRRCRRTPTTVPFTGCGCPGSPVLASDSVGNTERTDFRCHEAGTRAGSIEREFDP